MYIYQQNLCTLYESSSSNIGIFLKNVFKLSVANNLLTCFFLLSLFFFLYAHNNEEKTLLFNLEIHETLEFFCL